MPIKLYTSSPRKNRGGKIVIKPKKERKGTWGTTKRLFHDIGLRTPYKKFMKEG